MRPRRQRRVAGRQVPVPPRAGRVRGQCQRQAQHDGVGAAHDGLGDVARGAHGAVGDDVAVHTGLVEVAHAGRPGIGDGGGLRSVQSQHLPAGADMARAGPYEHAGGSGAHQVQGRLVAHAATDDHRRLHPADERLEVERVHRRRHMLGRDDRARDDQQVDLGTGGVGGQLDRPLGPDPARGADPRLGDLGDAGSHQLGLDRPGVELADTVGRGVQRHRAQLGQLGGGVFAAGPHALEIEHPDPAELAHLHRGGRAGDTVGEGRQHGDVEAVGVDLPGDCPRPRGRGYAGWG